jgi:Fic family protein
MMFSPNFEITALIAKSLMAIEADRSAIDGLPIDVEMLASLRETARLQATHYSTQIEGNCLTEEQVGQAITGGRFPGRERDELEVRHYYRALEEVERLAQHSGSISQQEIQRLHGCVMSGRPTPTPYREGQNVIRDGATGAIIYMPPQASDVPVLMRQLTDWIGNSLESGELPIPIVAALAHNQFATIHPYYDGNGRTARLATTLILHRTGYGAKGIYNLEEYYAKNLTGYYRALTVGDSHNYYFGRVEASVTPFISYFCIGMAESLSKIRLRASQAATRSSPAQSELLRRLDLRQRQALTLFRDSAIVTTDQLSMHLKLGKRTVLQLCQHWLDSGFLVLHDPSRKARSYRCGPNYEHLVIVRS